MPGELAYSINFELLDVKTDPEGRYVLLHAIIDNVDVLILGIYMPPPRLQFYF